MKKSSSCCGMICSRCEHYPKECSGRGEMEGKEFRLEYTGGDCCVSQRECQNAVHIESLIGMLEVKDTSEAYKALQKLEKISDETGMTYRYADKFVNMISSDKYVIRVRGFRLFCKLAQWDEDFVIDENIDTALNILKDDKPTAVRQALAAVMDIVRYKPDLREVVKKAVSSIDCLRYKETMHSLLAKDINSVLSLIRELEN